MTLDDGGTPDDASDDQLVYTPNPGFDGHDTFMYTITDSNGDKASAAVTVTLKRLILTLNAFCENDVPYISYEIELPDGSWEIIYNDWRHWNPDQSDATVTVTLSVNPESTVTVQYPPATSVCSANPPQDTPTPPPGASVVTPDGPVATDNLNVPITSYNPIVIDVLVYTPKADVNNIKDRFTYTITDALGNTSTATVTVAVNCTSSQSSDGGDALGTLSILMMMFMTLMSGLYFIRKEEERGNL